MQAEKGIEEGELLTNEELAGNAVLVGGGLGLGLGAAGQLMKKAYPKFGGKGCVSYLNKAYEEGDPDAAQVVETLAGENPSRYRFTVYASPCIGTSYHQSLSVVVPQWIQYRAKNESAAATDLASTVRSIIDGASKKASKTDVDASQ